MERDWPTIIAFETQREVRTLQCNPLVLFYQWENWTQRSCIFFPPHACSGSGAEQELNVRPLAYTILFILSCIFSQSLKSQNPGLFPSPCGIFWISEFSCDYGKDKNLSEEHSCFSVAHRYNGQAYGHDMDLSEDNQPPANQAFFGYRTWIGILCMSPKSRLNVYLLGMRGLWNKIIF